MNRYPDPSPKQFSLQYSESLVLFFFVTSCKDQKVVNFAFLVLDLPSLIKPIAENIYYALNDKTSAGCFPKRRAATLNLCRLTHTHGSIGRYEGNPTTVGSRYSGGRGKVETLTNSGWISLNDHPNDMKYAHSLIGLKSGSMLAIGGSNPITSKVWILQSGLWSVAGNLQKPDSYTNSILVGNSVYVISGYGGENALQRIDLRDDEIINTEILGYHDDDQSLPVIFQADSFGFCVSQ